MVLHEVPEDRRDGDANGAKAHRMSDESIFDRLWRESASPTVHWEDVLDSHLTAFTHAIYDGLCGCRKCGSAYGWLGRYIMTNGRTQVRWVCQHCGDYGTFGALPIRFVVSLELEADELPVCRDRSDEDVHREPCVVCGDDDTEEHHWAPSSIFPEPEWWGHTVSMCTTHHAEWHRRMRAHGLRWPREMVRA